MNEKDIENISEMYKDEKEPLYEKLKEVIPTIIEEQNKKNAAKKKKSSQSLPKSDT